MALRDQPMRCGACTYRFVYTVREQRQRADVGLWESGTLLFCPRCKSADVQPVETGLLNNEAPRHERPQPASDQTHRSRPPERGAATTPHSAPRPGRSGDRPGGRPQGGADRPRRDDGPPRGPLGRPAGGRRPERRVARQTELRVRYVGTIKWFDATRGYGFIAEDEGGELFLHASGILVADAQLLREGTPVEYEIERTGRGPQAVDVVPLA